MTNEERRAEALAKAEKRKQHDAGREERQRRALESLAEKSRERQRQVRESRPSAAPENFRCVVKNCDSWSHEEAFVGELCLPCRKFLAGEPGGEWSQAFRNAARIGEVLLCSDTKTRKNSESLLILDRYARGALVWDVNGSSIHDPKFDDLDAYARDRPRNVRPARLNLTPEQIRSIRDDPRSKNTIAREFGMSSTAVWYVKHGVNSQGQKIDRENPNTKAEDEDAPERQERES